MSGVGASASLVTSGSVLPFALVVLVITISFMIAARLPVQLLRILSARAIEILIGLFDHPI
ncbi:MAG: hypothetical protein KF810_22275 [Rhizobiaceae bacterium]|nr:hypothetical protein [Rhizobiaceae bacterium]